MSFADVKPPATPPGGGTPPAGTTWPAAPAVASVLQFHPARNIGGIPLPANAYWSDSSNYVRAFQSIYALSQSYMIDPTAYQVGHLAIVGDNDSTWRLDKISTPPVLSDWTEIASGLAIKLWTPNKSWTKGDIVLVPWLPLFYRGQDLNIFDPHHADHQNADTYSVWVAIDDIKSTTPAEVGHGTTWLACNVPPGMYVTEGPITHRTVSWARVGHSTNTYFLDSLEASIVFGMFSSRQIFAAGDKVVVTRSSDPGGENNVHWIGKVFSFDGSPIHGALPVGNPATDTNDRFSTGWRRVSTIDTPIADARVPIGPNANGTAGQMAYDADHLYVCIAMDTWIRFNAGHGGGW